MYFNIILLCLILQEGYITTCYSRQCGTEGWSIFGDNSVSQKAHFNYYKNAATEYISLILMVQEAVHTGLEYQPIDYHWVPVTLYLTLK
jgi:hypothetical protein